MKEVKEYIRCFKDDNEYNEKRNGDYYEPWLSLTKKGIGDVKSFIGEYENGPMTVEQQFNYFGSYDDDYVNTNIIESNITAIDEENQTVTVDGYVFKFRNSQDNKYFYTYRGEVQTTGTVERTWIEEIQFDEQTLQISACTVNGTTFGMNNYDGEQYSWMEVDFDTMSVGSKSFYVDHELQVNESVTMTEQLRFNGYTSVEPVVGVLFKYINITDSIMEFISDNGRHVQVGDADGDITVKSIVETEEGETINRVNYNKTEYEKLLETPLTFDVQSNGNIVVSSQNYNLEYKKNDGEWIEVTSSTGGTVVSVVSGDTVQFRGNNSNGISSSIFSGTTSQFIIKGNIMSLLSEQNFDKLTSVPSSSFDNLFANCTGLTDASKLLLPATTLAGYCYRFMFHGCTSLTTTPTLPATTLAERCYESMFNGCTSLTTAPELPATTLANYCYYYMFEGCTSLTQAPKLPATTLASNCYGYMFYDCTSLTTAPELPATTLVNGCYRQMFQNCSNLNYIKCLATNKSAANCTYNWVNGVAPVGVFIKDSNMTEWTVGIDGIPEGWLTNEEKNIALSSNVKYISELGEVFSLKVAATSNWVASTTDNWISMSQRQGGLGVTTITINTNQTVTPRNGEITFVCGNKAVVFKVVQDNSYLEPLTFEIQSNGNIVWKANNTAYTVTLEYSKNGGEWTEITSTTGGTTLSVVSGDTVQFRGNNATMSYNYNYNHFSGTSCSFSTKGNIMSLINSTGFNELSALTSTYTFYNLFRYCTGLTDASKLLLPATTLADACYSMMFWRCTSLTTAPALPATTLANYCYDNMFTNCWSLTAAPELPATTLVNGCYTGMFTNCWSLTTAPELPATTLAESCYGSMFDGCSGLTTAPELPATTLASYCYNSMFEDCTSLTTAPELPATTLASYCYNEMFSGCTSLTTAPSILPATTLTYNCYDTMFAGCTSLTTAPELPATTLADWCYDSMFAGCTSLTQAPELPATTLANQCYYYMFQGCRSLTQAPELPAITLTSQCYQSMFQGCSNLNYIKCLATNISASNYTSNWVSGVSSTGTFVAADKATLWKRGNNGIPTNWNVQYVDERMSVVPLTFEIRSSGTIRWTAYNTAYTVTLQYSKNGGEWTTLKSTTSGARITVASGDTVRFRGDNATMCDKSFRYNSFNGTIGQFALKGNIMSLINSTGFSELSTLTSASTFYILFNNCTGLTDASELLLPATTLTEYCYANMFKGCTNLVSAPELPSTTLANYCYDSMFDGCTSLTTAPALPATTLTQRCYGYMFRNCTSLTTAPELPATTLANYCYRYMFAGCTSLTTAPSMLPATTLAEYCYDSMFNGCTSLTTAPSMLPATTLAQYCYYYMFNNCTGLTTAPELPATTLANYCYGGMFEGCSNLNYIKCLATDISASNCTYRWVAGVAASGTFVKDSNMTRWLINNNGIPVGWVTYNDNELVLSEASKYAPESGSVIQLKVISPSNWSASTTDNWITMSQTQGGGGITDVRIVVGATTTPRDGTVTFVCGEISVAFTVIQTDNIFQPLTFEIQSDGNIVWKAYNTAYTVTLEYKKNDGEWTSITSTTGGTTIPVVSGDTVQFRGNNTTMSSGSSRYNCFSGTTCQFAVKNNIMSLLDSTNFSTLTMLQSSYTFDNLFSYCTGLTNASKLILPATTLTMGCYYFMFNGCKSLTTTPELPATTLAYSCYQNMFNNCTSLTTAPALPATTLAQSCYSSMFVACTGLTTAPALPATTLVDSCYSNMFRNCSSLVQAPALPATTLAYGCYEYMFNNCTSLTTAPALPATTLAQSCYSRMFQGCTSLTTAPALPATTLANYCYYYMFQGCRSLTQAPELPATTLARSCYYYMFNNCTSLTTAPELPATTLVTQCYYGMFDGCTSLTTAPALPATTLAQECYQEMFQSCTSLVSAPELPATTLASYCYYFMFENCTGLTQAPELPATTLATACYGNMFQRCTSLVQAPALPVTTLVDNCYNGMFAECTSLTTAPALPATTLATYCYANMFQNCSNLNYVKCLATDISATGCTSMWVGNVSSTGTFVKNSNMTGWTTGTDGIPTGWTVQDAS